MIHCNYQKEIFCKATSQSVLTENVPDAYGTRTEGTVREGRNNGRDGDVTLRPLGTPKIKFMKGNIVYEDRENRILHLRVGTGCEPMLCVRFCRTARSGR